MKENCCRLFFECEKSILKNCSLLVKENYSCKLYLEWEGNCSWKLFCTKLLQINFRVQEKGVLRNCSPRERKSSDSCRSWAKESYLSRERKLLSQIVYRVSKNYSLREENLLLQIVPLAWRAIILENYFTGWLLLYERKNWLFRVKGNCSYKLFFAWFFFCKRKSLLRTIRCAIALVQKKIASPNHISSVWKKIILKKKLLSLLQMTFSLCVIK